jgi:hypothetical protein
LEPSNLGFLLLKTVVLVGVLFALFHLRGLILAEESVRESVRALRQRLIGRWGSPEWQFVLEFTSDNRATLYQHGAFAFHEVPVFEGNWAWEDTEQLRVPGKWKSEHVDHMVFGGGSLTGTPEFQARLARDGLTLTLSYRSGPIVWLGGEMVSPGVRNELTRTRQE